VQPEYFVRIKSGSTVQGSGPIKSISDWTVTRRMDAAGQWSFRMSAADAQAAQVVLKRSAEIYVYVGTAYQLVGGGIIDSISRQISEDGHETLTVGGGDDLRELTQRTVGLLGLFSTTPNGTWTATALGGAVRGLILLSNGRLLAGTATTGHVWSSDDGGLTWQDRGQLGAATTVYCFAEYSGSSVVAGTGAGGLVFTSSDNGSTWVSLGRAGNETHLYDAAMVQAGYLIIGGSNSYSGIPATKEIVMFGATALSPLSALVEDSTTIYDTWQNALCAAPGGLVGTDRGYVYARGISTWASAARPPGGSYNVQDLEYISPGVYWAATNNGGKIYASTTTTAWTTLATLSGRTSVTALCRVSSTLAWAAADGRIYKSVNNGANWTELYNLGSTVHRLTALADGTVIAACDNGNVYRSSTLYAPVTHAAAVASLAALAPAGWTFTADATPGNDAIFLEFAGESLLTAVLMLAKASQTHFYLSAAKTLTFIDTWTDSGVHAVQPQLGATLATTVAALLAMTIAYESWDVVTRCYPYGKENLTLAGMNQATISAPSGYTLSTSSNYVQHTAGYAAYGLIERTMVFDAITADANTSAFGNALVAAAVQYLADRCTPVTNYTVELGGCAQLLTPLKTVQITWMGDTQINANFYILDSTWIGNESGMWTTGLVVGDLPVRLKGDVDATAEAINRIAMVAAR
jgi:hypothetical protein